MPNKVFSFSFLQKPILKHAQRNKRAQKSTLFGCVLNEKKIRNDGQNERNASVKISYLETFGIILVEYP